MQLLSIPRKLRTRLLGNGIVVLASRKGQSFLLPADRETQALWNREARK